MKVCLFVATPDPSKEIKIYDEIIHKIIEKLGSFTIINFYNILKRDEKLIHDQNNISILRNKFENKIHYFNPLEKKEFLEYIRRDKIFAFDSLGKTHKFFLIRKLINKKNIKLILIMNLDSLSNQLPYSINSLKGYLFKLERKISNLIYKFLVIIKFFPNIFIYFESRKEIYQSCVKNKKKKLSSLFPFLNILYFENVYQINSLSHEHYLKNKNSLEEKKIIFLDVNYKHLDIISRENLNVHKLKEEYFNRLELFFTRIENFYNQTIEICLHPSSNKRDYEVFFKNRLISQNKTYESIIKASVVIFHESSIILDAIFYNKKIISLHTDLFGKYMSSRIDYYKNKFNLVSINLDKFEEYNMKNIIKDLEKRIKSRKDITLKLEDEERGSDKVTQVLTKYIKDYKLV